MQVEKSNSGGSMKLFDDIQSPRLLCFKGGLFGLLAVMSGTLTVLTGHFLYEIGMLAVCIWSSCRFYYFFFYVLDHYIGSNKNAGVFSMLLKWYGKKRIADPFPFQTGLSAAANLFADLPVSLPKELVENILVSEHVRIERIVSAGQSSPPMGWYDQNEHEWVIVLQGEATLQFEDEPESVRLCPGHYLLIAAHRKHRVVSTSSAEQTVWLAVFFNGNPLP
jgi:cupin 2 domain-containing protein